MSKASKKSKSKISRKSSKYTKAYDRILKKLPKLLRPPAVILLLSVTLFGLVGAAYIFRSDAATFSMTNTRDRLVQCRAAGITLTIQKYKPASGTPLSNCSYTVQNLLWYYNQTRAGHAVTIDGWYGSLTGEKVSSYKWYQMRVGGSTVTDYGTYTNMINYMNSRIASAGSTSTSSLPTGWTNPLPNATTITQTYTTSVGYNVSGCPYGYKHCAIDLAGGGSGDGTAVIAAASGTIIKARTSAQGSCGWATTGDCIVIDHGRNVYSVYNHVDIEKWSGTVSKGTRIGTLNLSGNVTGYHLHFMLVENGVVKDPKYFLSAQGVKLP